jgi:hypothetical protein
MASNDQVRDVAVYAASVRAALSDLPSDQAAVLLEDLEDHLRPTVPTRQPAGRKILPLLTCIVQWTG